MRKSQPAATRRTGHRMDHPHDFDLVDVLEGQTPGSIPEEYVEATDRCTLHDRAYCRHCADYGARLSPTIGVAPARWGPKKGEKGYYEEEPQP